MIRATRELACSSTYIRLRESDKSENKIKHNTHLQRRLLAGQVVAHGRQQSPTGKGCRLRSGDASGRKN
ncbi:hypothetical protein B296_00022874 [Ensete ventricosum]|uniref:Uncharacterized protein n=1 Tax=Ensete ventricosum TaxID=4639 RepID=A0A427A922_ENSVE|nr:hypothetical protein B296_00022874 [Ensete ventricosum]